MIQKFLDYIAIERRYSQRTVTAYQKDLEEFCGFLGWEPKDYNPKEIDENDIRQWMIHLLDEEHNSPRSVKRKLCCLKSFYKFLLRTGVVEKDITRRIVSPKTDKPLPVFFRESEMQTITKMDENADDFEGIRDGLIIQMLYQTGMRRAEMIGLKDSDIDTHEGQIRIFGKRNKERIVPIGENLSAQIEQYREMRKDFLQDNESQAFFLQKSKRGISPLTRDKLYAIVCRQMGEVSTLQKHSPHVLRHTFATTMLNNGADIRTIQTLLGHASLASTQVYTHTTFEQIKQTYLTAHPRAQKRKE